MSKKMNLSHYESGVCVDTGHPINTIEWLFQDDQSNNKKLVFFAYDANLCACPKFSTWSENEFKERQIKKVLERTSDFAGEVWLDDVKIK